MDLSNSIPHNHIEQDRTARGNETQGWEWKDLSSKTTFTADREPVGLEIPEGFTVHKDFRDNGEYVQVKFLNKFDMSLLGLGQCAGEGGEAVAHAVLKHLRIESPISVDQSIFEVAMEVEMSGKSVQQFMNKKGGCSSIETKFRNLLEEDGWDLMKFVYHDHSSRLTMEWRPKPKQ